MHVMESVVDLLQRQAVGDEVVDVKPPGVDIIDVRVKLGAGLDAAERRAGPLAARDKLEGTRGDLRAGGRDADDDGGAPALVGHLERGAHGVDVADGLERVVDAAISHVGDDLLQRLVGVVLGVEAVGGAELARKVELRRVGVDGDDARSLGLGGAEDSAETDGAEPEHGDGGAFLDLGGVDDAAHAGGDATAHEADLGSVGGRVDLDDGDLGSDNVLGEGGAAHEVGEILAVLGVADSAVGHLATALGDADLLAQVRLGRMAELAVVALGDVGRDNEVARYDGGDARADGLDDTRALVAENAREHALGVEAAESVGVSVADTGVEDLDADLAGRGRRDGDSLNLQVLLGGPGNGGLALCDGVREQSRAE